MKTILVLSDTHGNRAAIDALEPVPAESDFIIHLGDLSSDGGYLKSKYPDKTLILNGNCDMHRLGEDEIVTQIEGVKLIACHGHKYSVKTTLLRLAARAKEENCTLALYGHTHEARADEIDGVTLINPGCLTRYSQNSYCYLVISGDKFTHKTVWTNKRL